MDGTQIKFRGKFLHELSREELMEALLQALEHIKLTQGLPGPFGL